MSLAVPYPADTRAKGWRFEIDYEKVEQSDTWGLALEVPMAQPALLMMWLMAWMQVPCGSLPADENLIRVKCRIPAKSWPALRPLLMRGWWTAEDGRLYHDTIVARVLEMLEYRRKNALRQANHKGKTGNSQGSNALPAGHKDDSNDTGTGTGTNPSLRSGKTSGKYPAEFEAVWSAYPARPGASKPDSHKAWAARLKAGVDPAVILDGVSRYAEFCAVCKTEPGFIKQPVTFFGPGEHYLSDWTPPTAPPRAESIHDRRAATLAGLSNRGTHANSDDRTVEATSRIVE